MILFLFAKIFLLLNRIIEMTIGIIVGCMPAVAALIRNRGLPYSHAFKSLRSRLRLARKSTWSWIEESSKSFSRARGKGRQPEVGDTALRGQTESSVSWGSDGYFELVEARQNVNRSLAV